MKHFPKCVLITGSTDGIGLFTAKLFAKNASTPLILGVHGRNEERLKNSVEIIKREIPTPRTNQITIEQFCYDLSTMQQVQLFAEDVKQKLPNLDCLINNAAIFDKDGPHTTNDGYEMTFQVNVIAPFMLTILLGTTLKPFRIINTSSMSHTDSKHHLKNLDYENLQHEKGYSAYSAYGLSKLLVNMFTRGLKSRSKELNDLTLINMDPGTVNTKMLKAGWGMCGIPVDEADNTYQLATRDKFINSKEVIYYDNLIPTTQAKQVYDDESCQKLVDYLLQIIKLEIH